MFSADDKGKDDFADPLGNKRATAKIDVAFSGFSV
jgi:hypothetical protein